MIKRIIFLGLIFVIAIKTMAQQKQSFPYLTTSNGLMVAVYNSNNDMVEQVYPHIFANYDSAKWVHPFVGKIKLSSNEKPINIGYDNNTHVIKITYKNFAVYYFASFTRNDKIFYAVISGDKSVISPLNFTYEAGNGKEVTNTKYLINPFEPLPVAYSGNVLTQSFYKKTSTTQGEKYFMFSLSDEYHHYTNEYLIKTKNEILKTPSSLPKQEKIFMRTLMAKCKYPKGISPSEKKVVEQSISILKMSQVSDKEVFPRGRGQILASLRPGIWHVAWVRDGSFAIQAMTKLGMYAEAKKGMDFMLNAEGNLFKHYIYTDGKDYGPQVDYKISLTRYFGNGKEECDYNEYGPNIEYDDWGLFLTAFTHYVSESKNFDYYKKWNKTVTNLVADAIVFCIAQNGLVKADSGPWERHLKDIRQYTFTNAVCAKGLEQFAELQKQLNLPSKKYFAAANTIKQAIYKNLLVDNKFFKGNAQDQTESAHEYFDGGGFEVFANGLIADKKLLLSHMEKYNTALKINRDREGYFRLKSKDIYENQEWNFLDLRVAQAYILNGEKERGKKIIDFMTELANVNNNHISEMLSNVDILKTQNRKDYEGNDTWCYCIRDINDQMIGATPMVGYGAGVYVLALYEYYKK